MLLVSTSFEPGIRDPTPKQTSNSVMFVAPLPHSPLQLRAQALSARAGGAPVPCRQLSAPSPSASRCWARAAWAPARGLGPPRVQGRAGAAAGAPGRRAPSWMLPWQRPSGACWSAWVSSLTLGDRHIGHAVSPGVVPCCPQCSLQACRERKWPARLHCEQDSTV